MTTRDMLTSMGVRVVDVPGLSHAAVYVDVVEVLLVRPGLSDATWAKAAELVLLPGKG